MSYQRSPRIDLNPSSADRWTTCTASPQFLFDNWDKLPVSETVYNREGTTAHEIAAAMLQGRNPNLANCPTPITVEMNRHGWAYMEYVEGLRSSPHSKLLVESKLPLWYAKSRNAIVDAAVINPDSLHVVDYKYGQGVVVSPVENLQTAIYAISVGTLGQPLPTAFPVFIHIFQPRGRESDAPRVWETTWLDVCNLSQKIDFAAVLIQTRHSKGDVDFVPELQFAPSEKACQWCPARGGICTERTKAARSEILPLANLVLPTANTISEEQLCKILQHKDQIISWLKDAEGYALERMKAGHRLPGYKLVTGRAGNRVWSDPKAAARILMESTILKREEVISEETISVAQAEELIGKNKFNTALTDLISRPPGKPTIATEDDKRDDCLIAAETEFQPLAKPTP